MVLRTQELKNSVLTKRLEKSKVGNMTSRMKKFPRLVDYVEAHHPSLGKLIDALALTNSFTPRKGCGITFLVPDEDYINEITAVAETEEPEPATDMIMSLIIPIMLGSVSDWKNCSEDLPNLLGRKIEIASIREDRIILKNGSTITKNDIFKPILRSGNAERGNMAVWNIKGKVSLDAPKSGQKPGTKKLVPAPATRNGRQDDQFIRDFVKKVDKMELTAMRRVTRNIHSVKLTVLCNYLRYLLQHQSELEFKEHIDYFKHICDPSAAGGIEAAFYLTFCCRDAIDMNGVKRPGLNDMSSLMKILSDPSIDLFTSVDKPVSFIIENTSGTPADNELSEVISAISESVRPRSVDDLVKVYDAWAARTEGYAGAKFKTIPGLKLLIDEFKYYCSMSWLGYRQSGENKFNAYKDFLLSLEGWGHPHMTINNPELQSSMLGILRIFKQSPKTITTEHTTYIREFLSEDGAFRSERQEIKPDETGLRFIPLDQEYANDDMSLSSTARTELRNYMAKHGGKLPDF